MSDSSKFYLACLLITTLALLGNDLVDRLLPYKREITPAPIKTTNHRADSAAVAGSLPIAGVSAGLDRVDPAAYRGWRGDCPGAALDAWMIDCLLTSYDHGSTLLIDASANLPNIIDAGRAAVASISHGGCLWLTISGHGSRTRDTSNDEADGWDEQICLYDGRINDDRIWELLTKIASDRPDLHIFMISDTCHSGTNYRGGPIELSAGSRAASDNISLVHFAGCPPDKYSYGSAQGGVFTTALIDTFDPAISYAEWFRRAAALMPPNQRPVMETLGRPFAHRVIFDF